MSIAVIVVSYNYGAYLPQCLASITDNDSEDLRVIIVDDASTDESIDLATRWASTSGLPVDIVAKTENGGPASAYNSAREQIHDDDAFVCFIDADDVFEPQRFANQLALMRDREDLAVVYSDVRVFGDGLKFAPNLHGPQMQERRSPSDFCEIHRYAP